MNNSRSEDSVPAIIRLGVMSISGIFSTFWPNVKY